MITKWRVLKLNCGKFFIRNTIIQVSWCYYQVTLMFLSLVLGEASTVRVLVSCVINTLMMLLPHHIYCFNIWARAIQTHLIYVADLSSYISMYFTKWKKFMEYWLIEYRRPVYLVYYSDLLNNRTKFVDVARFLGYVPEATEQRFVILYICIK